jgi:hypothetical protein
LLYRHANDPHSLVQGALLKSMGGVHLDVRLLDGYSAPRRGRRHAHLQAVHYRQLLNTTAAPSLCLLLHDGAARVHLLSRAESKELAEICAERVSRRCGCRGRRGEIAGLRCIVTPSHFGNEIFRVGCRAHVGGAQAVSSGVGAPAARVAQRIDWKALWPASCSAWLGGDLYSSSGG